FTEDNEIIYYSDVEEMVDKCRFYLKDDNFILREKLKLNARRRAINEHTWSHRFNSIFESLGIK
ncbi:glycosyltransferase family 1 protein, partial [Vibrio parahaemolyticus]|nr:glycosyltransferase family 1 protein [Vibrio parahaemolyticus]